MGPILPDMRLLLTNHNRRTFIRLTGGVMGGLLLSGCGGGGAGETASETVSAAPITTQAVSHPLNLALMLAYVGAQFYGVSANGVGLDAALTSGIGRQGAATGVRQVAFGDPAVARHAGELAADKLAHVVALRGQLATLTAAQPAIDLSPAPFSLAVQESKLVADGAGFDPYASDMHFLIGAFLIENRVAAAHRTLLAASDSGADLVAANLADTIYHGGLIRTLLDERATTDAVAGQAVGDVSAWLATLDGSNQGDQTLAGASGPSSDITDAGGRPIAFTRDKSQMLKALYLSTGSNGGFLPAGANGLPA